MPELTDSQRPAEVVRKAWAETLLAERKSRRPVLTQATVAKSAGIDQSTLSDIERGKGSLETFLAVAAVLGVTLVQVPDGLPETEAVGE